MRDNGLDRMRRPAPAMAHPIIWIRPFVRIGPEQGGQGGNLSEAQEEDRKIRRLQIMMSMVMSVISQDPDLTIEEASEMAANTKRAALAMFPDKEFAYDILYKPRLQRLINERFRIQ